MMLNKEQEMAMLEVTRVNSEDREFHISLKVAGYREVKYGKGSLKYGQDETVVKIPFNGLD